MSEQLEAIADAVSPTAYDWLAPDHQRPYRKAASRVITHLWEQADSSLVDDIVSIHGMSRTEAEGIVDDVLAALLGPPLNGDDDEGY